MLFVDLLRLTVLLIAASATALGAVTVVAAEQDADSATLIFAGAWWTLAAVLGILLGGSSRAGEAMSRALSSARTATSLPTESPGRIAFLRLWPIAAFAIVVGGLAWLFPQVAAVGAGFAILNALAWRNRERVMALYSIVFLGSAPIGGPITGLLIEAIDPRATLVLAGVSGVVAAIGARTAFRRLPAPGPPLHDCV